MTSYQKYSTLASNIKGSFNFEKRKKTIQPVSGTKVPRFAGPSTFARLPELRDVKECDVAIVGIPFDAGTSYRPGARSVSYTHLTLPTTPYV